MGRESLLVLLDEPHAFDMCELFKYAGLRNGVEGEHTSCVNFSAWLVYLCKPFRSKF